MVRSLTVIGGGPSGDEIFARDGGPFGGVGLPLVILLGGVDAVVVAISELMLETALLFVQIPSTLKTNAKIPHATITYTMPVTTASVAASPTAEELLPHWNPRRHPATAIIMP
jgi:hypothetical protein